MGKRIFVSYSHKQGEWVRDKLEPVLTAWGATVLIDYRRFETGGLVYEEMNAAIDEAELHLLVLSPDYLASSFCIHEMERAVAKDPTFGRKHVLPVVRIACSIPAAIGGPTPLIYTDLTDDQNGDQWDGVTARCGEDLGFSAAEWLRVRGRVGELVARGKSVNLLVGKGRLDRGSLWQQLERDLHPLGVVDLAAGNAVKLEDLIPAILRELGLKSAAPRAASPLADLNREVMDAPRPVRLALRHGDVLPPREYAQNFCNTLKALTDKHRLVILIESRVLYSALLRDAGIVSEIPMDVVELRGRTP